MLEGGINFKGLVYDAVARTLRVPRCHINKEVVIAVTEKESLFEATLRIPSLYDAAYTSDRCATRRMAEHQAASYALDVNWPDVVQTAKTVYQSQRAGGKQAPAGTNRKGKLLENLQILLSRNVRPGDVAFETVPFQDASGPMFVSTVSFLGIGREDFYTGTPEPTEKEAEHSAAEVASGALEPEFSEAQQRMEEKKERINIRKAMGLSAAVQLLLGPGTSASDYSVHVEEAHRRNKRGFTASLSVPGLGGGFGSSLIPEAEHEQMPPATSDGVFKSNWRPTEEEAEEAAVDTFFSVMEPAFVALETDA
jgi:hypothetical protein